jgi:hypothetical protein
MFDAVSVALASSSYVDDLQHTAKLMTTRDRHPDKDIRKAITDAQRAGWTVEQAKGKGHRWGTLSCGQGCAVPLAGTPRRPGDIAKRIREAIKKCDHNLGTPDTERQQKSE